LIALLNFVFKETMKEIKPITHELVEEAQEAAFRASAFEQTIIDRISYIMASVFKLFGKNGAYWWFSGADEGEVGSFWKNYDPEQVSVITECTSGEEMIILLKDGSEWGLVDGFPTRWLFEDFETEIQDGKQKYKEKEIRRKAEMKKLSEQQKVEHEALIQSAKSKLSKKELNAIKKYL
jgi:hypothetical protein